VQTSDDVSISCTTLCKLDLRYEFLHLVLVLILLGMFASFPGFLLDLRFCTSLSTPYPNLCSSTSFTSAFEI
jgi:flagellar biosynthesis component FlhA